MPEKDKPTEPNYSAPKPTLNEFLTNGKEFNRVSTDFLKIDVATALTLAGIALGTADDIKKRRSRRAARKAYDTICRFAKSVELSNAEAQTLSSDLARLKSDLQTLDEIC